MPPTTKSRMVIPVGYAHVTLKMSGPNTLHPPSFGFGVFSNINDNIVAGLLAFINDSADAFKERLYDGYVVDRAIVRFSDATYENPLNIPGEGVGADLVTPAVSSLIKELTATSGRRGSGRMYWPGCLNETDVDNAGRLTLGAISSLQNVAEHWLEAMQTANADPVLLHSYTWPYGDADPGVPAGFPAPSPVVGVVAQSVVATQRRRQR